MTDARSGRSSLRVSAEQCAVIERAASVKDETLTDYVVRNVVSAATNDLAERRYFELKDAAWTEFDALLARPPVFKARLDELMSSPEPWVD